MRRVLEQAREGAEFVLSQSSCRPRIGIILGSGISTFSGYPPICDSIPYAVIPHFPEPTVEGHDGILSFVEVEGMPIALMRGRVHLYEGWVPQELGFTVRLLRAIGCDILVVTNAAGGLNTQYNVGDLMLISDHIFLPGLAAMGPLIGDHVLTSGPRFVDLGECYDSQLRHWAIEAAVEAGLKLHSGVYVMCAGPQYETPAECRYLRIIGADAVGMSTCPEVVVARQAGMRVLAVSTITNVAADLAHAGIEHSDVVSVAAAAAGRLEVILAGVIKRIRNRQEDGEEAAAE